jgi:hypothetical protein
MIGRRNFQKGFGGFIAGLLSTVKCPTRDSEQQALTPEINRLASIAKKEKVTGPTCMLSGRTCPRRPNGSYGCSGTSLDINCSARLT